jgi:hypothetical protein
MKGITDKQMEMVALFMSQMSDQQLDEVTAIHKRSRQALNRRAIKLAQIGDTVTFTSSQPGNPLITGKIIKKANKNLTVKEINGYGRTYRVPAGMVEFTS